MELGKKLTQLRKQKNLTQREFANAIRVSSGAIGMWETNKRLPDLETIQVIAQFYNVSIDFLVNDSSTIPILPTTNKANVSLSSEEYELLEYYRNLSNIDKRWIMGQIIDLIKKQDASELAPLKAQ